MNLFIALALCFVPLYIGIILCLVFVKGFKSVYVFYALFLGLLAIILIILVRTAIVDIATFIPIQLTGYIGLLFSVILYAFVEESVKMLLLAFLPKKLNTLGLYSITCLLFGCTVGSFETLMYLVTEYSDTVARLFTAVVVHTLCALLSGFFVWSVKNNLRFLRAFLMSFLLHGVYNFFASQVSFLWWFSIVTILFLLFKCRIYYSSLKEKSDTLVVPS